MLKIITIERNNGYKIKILILLALLILGLGILDYLDLIYRAIYSTVIGISTIVLVIFSLTKNYKENGYILLGINQIKIFHQDKLVNDILIGQNGLNFITIKKGISPDRIDEIIDVFKYFPEFRDSIEFSVNSVIYMFDIELERTKMETKRFELFSKKLESKEIKLNILEKEFKHSWVF
jgi:hypothetical protein